MNAELNLLRAAIAKLQALSEESATHAAMLRNELERLQKGYEQDNGGNGGKN